MGSWVWSGRDQATKSALVSIISFPLRLGISPRICLHEGETDASTTCVAISMGIRAGASSKPSSRSFGSVVKKWMGRFAMLCGAHLEELAG